MRTRIPTLTPERYHRLALWSFVLLALIVFSGAAVRLTGSGLGCPDWPKCTGTSAVAPLDTHALIEFVNRVFSGIVAAAAAAAGLLALRRRPYRRDLMLLGMALPLGVLGQGILGGLTVLYDLRPGFVMGHFGLSMVVLIAAWALYWRSRPGFEAEQASAQPDRGILWASRALLPIGAVVVFAGTAATAAGPHAGGAGTGDKVVRLQTKGPRTLDWAIHNHGVIAAILGIGVISALAFAWWRGAGTGLLRALGAVTVLLVLQGIVGAVQYSLELPSELVWVHVCLATCTWVALLWVWSAAGSPAGARSTQSPAERSRSARAAA